EGRTGRGLDRSKPAWTGRLGRAHPGRTGRGRSEADDCHGQCNHTQNNQENPPVLDEEPDHDEGEEGATPDDAGARATRATTFGCHAAGSHLVTTIFAGRSARGRALISPFASSVARPRVYDLWPPNSLRVGPT